MATAADRVAKYLDEHARMRSLDPVRIHGLHSGDDARAADLTTHDLRVVLAQRGELLAFAKKVACKTTFTAARRDARALLCMINGVESWAECLLVMGRDS